MQPLSQPPRAPTGCSLYPRGMFFWDFCILVLFSNTSEAKRRRAGLSHSPHLNHSFVSYCFFTLAT